jgi:Clp protease
MGPRLPEGDPAEHTGRPVEQVHEDMDRDRFFTAEEVAVYGVVVTECSSPSRATPETGPGGGLVGTVRRAERPAP